MRLGFLTALACEARVLRRSRQLNDVNPILCCGIGAAALRKGVAQLAQQGVDAIVLIGFAGGIDPTLAPGNLVTAKGVVAIDAQGNTKAYYAADPVLLARLGAHLDRAGLIAPQYRAASLIATTPQPITTPDAKARLAAASQAVAVDMETAEAAEAASAMPLPWGAIRVIVDTADTPLPSGAADLIAADGTILRADLFHTILRHPRRWRGFYRLARQRRHGLAGLRTAMRAMTSSTTAH